VACAGVSPRDINGSLILGFAAADTQWRRGRQCPRSMLNCAVEAGAIIVWCRNNPAHYKAPRHVVFGAPPKTSTGKVRKFVLHKRAGQVA
jgi:acyl-CoA synthetase (AMP-forming)/AMP-acid ligase II